jgi:pyruvate ferredoxin oxidoreductase beta subunit
MAYNLKKLTDKSDRLTGGHRMCAGCGAPIVVRTVLRALKPEDHAVIASATGCLEVSTCLYPYSAWKDSFIHSAFENSAATVSGAEAAYRSLMRTERIDGTTKFIAFGGDGGTYDIGLQSLSGAMERGHDMVYVCYDNEAYFIPIIKSIDKIFYHIKS